MSKKYIATLRDVADLAGVSTATASFALNGKGRVAPETIERITQAAQTLNYEPNLGARNFSKKRAGAIGLYLPGGATLHEYYMELAFGALETAWKANSTIVLLSRETGSPTRRIHVDGIVIIDPMDNDPAIAEMLNRFYPVVTGEPILESLPPPAATIYYDHVKGTRMLLDHFIAQGASQVGMIAAEPNSAWSRTVRDTYMQWCAEHGVTPTIQLLGSTYSHEEVLDATEQLLSSTHSIDAILAAPDGTAPIVVAAAKAHGRQVGADLLVAAYVDNRSLALTHPSITALEQYPRVFGERTMSTLLHLIENGSAKLPIEVIPLSLRARASTGVVSHQI